ncbi:MAG: Uma2 family endonuclease [Hyphomicrobiaceae bacterium]
MNIRANIAPAPVALPADVTRRLWTAAELRQLETAGILGHDERVELIAGEIVKVSPKGARHEVLRNELVLYWARRLPPDVKFAEEPPLTLGDQYEPEPDIILFPATLRVNEVGGDTVLLVVEIADSSLSWDLDTKAKVYAMFGVREYWVINAKTRETTVHRQPGDQGYAQIDVVQATDLLTPAFVPALAVSIGTLPL